MLRYLFRFLLALLAARFVYLFVRHLTGGDRSPRLEEREGARSKRVPKGSERPLVDRSAAIDVPFTEERPGSSNP